MAWMWREGVRSASVLGIAVCGPLNKAVAVARPPAPVERQLHEFGKSRLSVRSGRRAALQSAKPVQVDSSRAFRFQKAQATAATASSAGPLRPQSARAVRGDLAVDELARAGRDEGIALRARLAVPRGRLVAHGALRDLRAVLSFGGGKRHERRPISEISILRRSTCMFPTSPPNLRPSLRCSLPRCGRPESHALVGRRRGS